MYAWYHFHFFFGVVKQKPFYDFETVQMQQNA